MATFGSALRRGLPRAAGGDAWPPAGAAPVAGEAAESASAVEVQQIATPEAPNASDVAGSGSQSAGSAPAGGQNVAPSAGVEVAGADSGSQSAGSAPAGGQNATPSARALRRGLPREVGGEAWPPAAAVAAEWTGAGVAQTVTSEQATRQNATPEADAGSVSAAPVARTAASEPATRQHATPDADAGTLRRGLPRAAGGDPWPPAGTLARAAAPTAEPMDAVAADAPEGQLAAADEASATAAATAPAATVAVDTGPRAPLPFTRSVWPGRAAAQRPAQTPEPQRLGPFTKLQWAGAVIIGGLGLLFAAAMAVLFVRFFLSLEVMQDFIATYPGEYHLPEGAPVGIPAWLGWQHFFNVFLMVLIIRTGLTIRTEKRPAVFWTPRNNPKGKTSLTIWFHQSLDLLWIVNGLVFVVLLFVTGQWMRIVPTSWEVFPNAVSAALQYVSLDWPTENGWVNYNSLQQIAYFSTVFLAAPLAIVTGFRMSGLWPKNNARLNAAYPIEWARKVHFPTMLFFVVFIAIHVFLVFATGALRNLNHMYAAQGSVDGVAYADNWTGFWFFVASLAVIAVAWIAARPLVLAPIARLFGTVSGR